MLQRMMVLTILMGMLAGCAQAGAGGAAQATLENTKWKLVEMGAPGATMPELSTVEVTLQFDDKGRAGGNSGCNQYGGSYALKGDTITFGEMMSTMMACDEPRMQLEQSYLAALRSASKIEIGQDVLTIAYGDGGARLVFNRQ